MRAHGGDAMSAASEVNGTTAVSRSKALYPLTPARLGQRANVLPVSVTLDVGQHGVGTAKENTEKSFQSTITNMLSKGLHVF